MLYAIMLFSPLYIVFIWQFFNAKKAIARGQATLLWRYSGYKLPIALRKWQHNPVDEADVTELEISQVKNSALVGIVTVTAIVVFLGILSILFD